MIRFYQDAWLSFQDRGTPARVGKLSRTGYFATTGVVFLVLMLFIASFPYRP